MIMVNILEKLDTYCTNLPKDVKAQKVTALIAYPKSLGPNSEGPGSRKKPLTTPGHLATSL